MVDEIHISKIGYDFYKASESDKIWKATKLCSEEEVQYLFSFDCEKVYNFWTDYPEKLTPEQIVIFKKENLKKRAYSKLFKANQNFSSLAKTN